MKREANSNEDKQGSKFELVNAFRSLVLGGVMYWYADKYLGTQNFIFDPRSEVLKKLDTLAKYR